MTLFPRVRRSLLAKVTALFGITIVLLGAIIVTNQNAQVIPIIDHLRDTLAAHEEKKIDDLLTQQIASIRSTTLDYANWAEMKDFALHPRDEWLNDNLNNEGIANLEMDIVLVINRTGTAVFTHDRHPGKEAAPMTDASLQAFRETFRFPLTDAIDFVRRDDVSGMAIVNGLPAALVMAPITGTWDPVDASAGVLVMGQYLVGESLTRLQHVSGALFSLDDGRDREDTMNVPLPGYRLITRTIQDMHGKPGIRMHLSADERIFRQAERLLQWGTVGILMITVLLMILLLQSVYTNIVARIIQLAAAVDSSSAETVDATLSTLRSSDETGVLATEISRLLRRLKRAFEEESAQRSLMATRALLEDRVAERSQQLQRYQQELRDKQQELLDKEKLSSMEVFTGSIVSSLDRPTQRIGANSEILQTTVGELDQWLHELLGDEPDPEVASLFREHLAGITDQFDELRQGQARVHRIVDALNTIVDLQDREQVCVDVIDCLTRLVTEATVHRNGREDVILQYREEIQAEVWPSAFSTCLRQLIINACKALRDAPGVSQPTLTLSVHIRDQGLVIDVCDNGAGMAAVLVDKVFDAFFTTRVVGDGVGLGLTMARAAAQRHGGTITLTSTPGEGTLASVFLPVKVRVVEAGQ